MLTGTSDIVYVSYVVPWNQQVSIGLIIRDNYYLVNIDSNDISDYIYKPCHIVGFGCTYIRNYAIMECEVATIEHADTLYIGEDIGFFLKCHNLFTVSYISYVNHKFDRIIDTRDNE